MSYISQRHCEAHAFKTPYPATLLGILLLGHWLIGYSVSAQTAVPGVIDPGSIQERLDLPDSRRENQASTPQVDTSTIVPPEAAESINFKLRNLEIKGVTVYSNKQLRAYYAEYLEQTISLRTIYEIIDDIIQRYRRDDYALVSALVTSQDFDKGHIAIRFVEGYVSQIKLAKDLQYSQDAELLEKGQLARYADNIRAERPLTKQTLQRNLLLANDIPGLRVDGGFDRSETPGAVDLSTKVKQEQFETFGSIDNYGPEELGPTQFQFGAAYNSLFRVGDSTKVTLGGTPDIDTLKYAFLKHSQIVGNSGLRLGADLGYMETRPDIDGIEGIKGEAKFVSFSARYPWLRSLRENLYFYSSFDYLESDNAFLQRTLSSNKIRSLRFGTFYNKHDNWAGNNSINVSISQGLDIMGAEADSRPNGRLDYTKLNFYLQRLQRFGDHFRAVATVSGQYSFSKLFSSEEYSYGGREFGRAFRPSEITGDHGLAGSLELSYRNEGPRILKSYEPYVFADAGKIWRREELFISQQLSGASAGGGLRLMFSRYLTVEVEAAKAVYRSIDQFGEDDWQFFFRLTGEY